MYGIWWYHKKEVYSLSEVHVFRNEQVIHMGKIKEFKQMKRDIVTTRNGTDGMECGIMFDDFSDFQQGDPIQYVIEKEITFVL